MYFQRNWNVCYFWMAMIRPNRDSSGSAWYDLSISQEQDSCESLFEEMNQLTGNVFLKGRIYGIVLIKAAIEIYFNKNIKYVINRWKHKED